MKRKITLTKEEREIENAIVRGKYAPVSNLKGEKKRFEGIARHTLLKTKTISVRITERNLMRLKAAAAREGLPYQTLLTSILHKHV